MATSDDSFQAEGDNPPRLVAFETTAPSLERVHSFGVAVYAKQCGVNALGVSLATLNTMPNDPHLFDPPNLVGVRGLGESEGVRGDGPIGVRGLGKIPGSLGGAGVGVQGEGGAVGVSGDGGTYGVKGDGIVAGVRGNGLIGVQGEGRDAGMEGIGPVGVRGVGQSSPGWSTGVEGNGDSGVRGKGRIGVEGEGDAGVLGRSKRGRGGVFATGQTHVPVFKDHESQPSAQLVLVPNQVSGAVIASLPRNGHAGDLIVMVSTERKDPAAELWFCIRGSDDPSKPGAIWGQVQFATTITVP